MPMTWPLLIWRLLVAPERVVICEGEPRNRRVGTNYSHDARCYNRIFRQEFPETQFIPGGNSDEVRGDTRGLAYALGILVQGTAVIQVIDRDAHSEEEVLELRRRDVTCSNAAESRVVPL